MCFLSKLNTIIKLFIRRIKLFIRCAGNDAQGVHTLPHERCDGCIDQSVAFELRTSFESVGDEHDAEVTALTRAPVAGMLGAVVDDFERERRQLALQCQTKLLDFGGRHRVLLLMPGGRARWMM